MASDRLLGLMIFFKAYDMLLRVHDVIIVDMLSSKMFLGVVVIFLGRFTSCTRGL